MKPLHYTFLNTLGMSYVSLAPFSDSQETRVASLHTRISYREMQPSSREKQDETGDLLLSGTVGNIFYLMRRFGQYLILVHLI